MCELKLVDISSTKALLRMIAKLFIMLKIVVRLTVFCLQRKYGALFILQTVVAEKNEVPLARCIHLNC